jgi:hypothetical protein
MTQTIEHVRRVEVTIEKLKGLLSAHGYPDDLRTVILAGTMDPLIEHHEAMLLLIRSQKVGSAFALSRPLIEGMYRGLRLNFCATDQEVQKFEKEDKLPLTMQGIADAIDEKYRGGFLR